MHISEEFQINHWSSLQSIKSLGEGILRFNDIEVEVMWRVVLQSAEPTVNCGPYRISEQTDKRAVFRKT